LPAFYSNKLAYGPQVVSAMRNGLRALSIDDPVDKTLRHVALALDKRVCEVVVVVMNRPRHSEITSEIRRTGACLRLISDGDITAAVAPSLPDSGVDLYLGIGGTPEGVLAAAALRALGGDILSRMYPRDDEERANLLKRMRHEELQRIYNSEELVRGESALFCATGISDSALLPGVRLIGKKAITHSILVRSKSRTVRYIRAIHDLDGKTIHLRSARRDQKL
jgi:fructose-1,6-bisphosphatase II